MALAISKLFGDLQVGLGSSPEGPSQDAGIQYKETLSSCALQLAQSFKATELLLGRVQAPSARQSELVIVHVADGMAIARQAECPPELLAAVWT